MICKSTLRCRAGQQAQTHDWICIDPVKAFVATDIDHASRVGKAAATRVAKNWICGHIACAVALPKYAWLASRTWTCAPKGCQPRTCTTSESVIA